MQVTSYNYFEVAEALHCFLTLNHDGQWFDKYEALCRSKFKPGPGWFETNVIKDNYLYDMINEKNWKQIEIKLTEYLERNENE